MIINCNQDDHDMSWANDHDDYCDLDDSYCVIVIIVIMMNIVIMLIIVIMNEIRIIYPGWSWCLGHKIIIIINLLLITHNHSL